MHAWGAGAHQPPLTRHATLTLATHGAGKEDCRAQKRHPALSSVSSPAEPDRRQRSRRSCCWEQRSTASDRASISSQARPSRESHDEFDAPCLDVWHCNARGHPCARAAYRGWHDDTGKAGHLSFLAATLNRSTRHDEGRRILSPFEIPVFAYRRHLRSKTTGTTTLC